ncbi:MAG: hypothetical protein ACI3W8_03820 [Oscillospiraceae bacterium]
MSEMNHMEFAERLRGVEEQCRGNTRRIEGVEKRQDSLEKLVTSVEVLATRQETVESDVKEIKSDVKALAEKPGKRWEGIADKLLWLLIGGAVAFVAVQMGVPLG